MNKTLILSATKKELSYLYGLHTTEKLSDNMLLGKTGNIYLAYTGIGKNNVCVFVENFDFSKFDNIVICGLAGGLKNNMNKGDIFIASEVSYKSENINLHIPSNNTLVKTRLLTCEHILNTHEKKNLLNSNYDMVDMETFFIANFILNKIKEKKNIISIRSIWDLPFEKPEIGKSNKKELTDIIIKMNKYILNMLQGE